MTDQQTVLPPTQPIMAALQPLQGRKLRLAGSSLQVNDGVLLHFQLLYRMVHVSVNDESGSDSDNGSGNNIV